jgi:UPF0176 protein
MNRAVLLAAPVVLLGVSLVGCGPDSQASPPPSTVTSVITVSPSAATAPPAPTPATQAKCPYLDSQFVADANGQHVSTVKISSGTDAHPSCFFYRPDGGLQLTVRVYSGDPATATAVVNQAAPVASSDPASQPTGWNGGSQALSKGAVYAVAKGGTAVVVLSNQEQTIKCRLIAVQAISGLGM